MGGPVPRMRVPTGKHVERSLITLKALTYQPTGGIVAAVTTSLPEQLGGSRNWDYRYCWLRDATFTLLALMNGGYYQEARQWQAWLLRAIAGSAEQAQIMYGIAGQRRLLEWEIPWLDGYEGSKPVRVGNAAAGQLQLDIYGELMDAFFHALDRLDRKPGIGLSHASRPGGSSRAAVGKTRSGHLGDARRPPTLYLLQGDGLGRLRPCDPGGGEIAPPPPDRTMEEGTAKIHAEVCAEPQPDLGQLCSGLRLRSARRIFAADASGRLSPMMTSG